MINTNYYDSIPRMAEYGNILVPADNLAQIRGSGQFNNPPKNEQTTDRGRAFSNALEVYGNGPYYQKDQNEKIASYDKYEQHWDTPESLMDYNKRQDYVVGTTSFHPENKNSWNRPDYDNSRGSDQYQVWAVNSTKMTPNALLNFFFSEDNVNYLQSQMIKEIKRIRGIDISAQSIDELLIIMRNNYLYALSGWLPAGDVSTSKGQRYIGPRGTIQNPPGKFGSLAYNPNSKGCTSLEEQIIRLNKSVLQECIKQILSGIGAYEKYYLDASSIPMPLTRPVYTSQKGSNVLQENIGFQSGHENSTNISSFNNRFNII
jgi:hypothetical protein